MCVCAIKSFASKLFGPGTVFIHMGNYFVEEMKLLLEWHRDYFFLINGINFL